MVIGVIVVLALFVLILLASAIRILREYERGVIFRLGRLIAQKGPGLILLIPIVDRMVRVDLRTVTLNVPPQELISRDNVTVRVNAVVYFRVVDPNRAITEVENFLLATSQIAQTTLRSVLGKAELDALLSERASQHRASADHRRPDRAVGDKGVHGRGRGRRAPAEMQRAIARQAEAEREQRERSSTRTGSSRRPRSSPTPRRSSVAIPPRSSSATSRRCSRSG